MSAHPCPQCGGSRTLTVEGKRVACACVIAVLVKRIEQLEGK